ncbi:MAG: hypothetical protein RLZZ631_2051 [Cyanobacteriota bacterium]|jgi:hypothetical protein
MADLPYEPVPRDREAERAQTALRLEAAALGHLPDDPDPEADWIPERSCRPQPATFD